VKCGPAKPPKLGQKRQIEISFTMADSSVHQHHPPALAKGGLLGIFGKVLAIYSPLIAFWAVEWGGEVDSMYTYACVYITYTPNNIHAGKHANMHINKHIRTLYERSSGSCRGTDTRPCSQLEPSGCGCVFANVACLRELGGGISNK